MKTKKRGTIIYEHCKIDKETAERDFLSLREATKITAISRSTIGYWVRSKKIRASRMKGQYYISKHDLFWYLYNNGYKVPKSLAVFETTKNNFETCHEYFSKVSEDLRPSCPVLKMDTTDTPCWIIRKDRAHCISCEYWVEIWASRLKILDQLNLPAAMITGLWVLGANKNFASLIGKDLENIEGEIITDILPSQNTHSLIQESRIRATSPDDTLRMPTLYVDENTAIEGLLLGLVDPPNTSLLIGVDKSDGICDIDVVPAP